MRIACIAEAVSSTGLDRLRAKLDRVFHAPPNERVHLENPSQALDSLSTDGRWKGLWESSKGIAAGLCGEMEANLRQSLPQKFGKVHAPSGQWLQILRSIYVIVRLVCPEAVLETGTGLVGASSTFILQGLEDENRGRLFSVDPDKFAAVYGTHVGLGIPARLRNRLTVVRGTSKSVLPRLLGGDMVVGVFLHDSSHTYRNMTREFESIWPRLAAGGYLLSDDTINASLDDFCRAVSLPSTYVRYANSSFGYVRKPLS